MWKKQLCLCVSEWLSKCVYVCKYECGSYVEGMNVMYIFKDDFTYECIKMSAWMYDSVICKNNNYGAL